LDSFVEAISVKCTNLSLAYSRLLTTSTKDFDFNSSLEKLMNPSCENSPEEAYNFDWSSLSLFHTIRLSWWKGATRLNETSVFSCMLKVRVRRCYLLSIR